MNKREKLTLFLIAAILVGSVGLLYLRNTTFSQKTPGTGTEPVTFPAGSTVTLDSDADDTRFTTADGIECRLNFSWTGSMQLTVLDSTLYKGEKAVEAAEATGAYLPSDNNGLLLVKYRLKNDNAVPVSADFTGSEAFSASIFGVPGAEARFFSASESPEGSHEYFSFQLDPGSDIEFTMGYLPKNDVAYGKGDALKVMTPGADGAQGHYRIELGTQVIE